MDIAFAAPPLSSRVISAISVSSCFFLLSRDSNASSSILRRSLSMQISFRIIVVIFDIDPLFYGLEEIQVNKRLFCLNQCGERNKKPLIVRRIQPICMAETKTSGIAAENTFRCFQYARDVEVRRRSARLNKHG